eukprot:CAMPEP_0174315838 /NCGR_PEP_ID=MMETSP0810-20121108/6541_1 /TAXON_ID=73025 ORGANISM="Eutreptiella gymnastica-like, Strain CCMP1594" /NCGR_SAMPLE_ID=MMETSP0810 /ASSEMBLY_ACC=CAM_ASM_000659 /LENGTH=99 /DNA_ID=CAMNT_0015425333 /DNA_START=286 /DNA_END=582 /DNA_ORIENTATION=-
MQQMGNEPSSKSGAKSSTRNISTTNQHWILWPLVFCRYGLTSVGVDSLLLYTVCCCPTTATASAAAACASSRAPSAAALADLANATTTVTTTTTTITIT